MANKTLRQKEAIEQLRVQVDDAKKSADDNVLWQLGNDELEKLTKDHKLGDNYSGWKNPYPEADPRSLLLEYQFRYFHDKSRFKIGMQSRQSGKDFTTQGEAAADCESRKTEWMTAAPSERQALDSLDQGKVWSEAFGLVAEDYVERREGSTDQTLLKSAEITWSNGSKNRAVPGKPNTVRGRSSNLILTEFDFFEQPDLTWRAILPSITNPLRGGQKCVRIMSTPNGQGSAMHKLWNKKQSAKSKVAWSKHKVTILHAVLMGLPVDIDELREMFDDTEGWLQEFMCEFLDTASVLLPYELIGACESIEATESWNIADAGSTHPVFMGVDFGRQNDPSVAWTCQLIGGTLITREVLVLEKMSSPDQQQILRDRISQASLCCFDYTGPGLGLGDYLVEDHGEWDAQKQQYGKVELCTFTVALKREIFSKTRQKFEEAGIKIPIGTEIREDLHQMQQTYNGDSYNYWSPRTRLGHSDRCTALALCIRAAKLAGSSAPFHHQSVPMGRQHGSHGMIDQRSMGGMMGAGNMFGVGNPEITKGGRYS
ncbi:terminase large subunit domain-containing protein [Rubritalea sp.]|uniref:terminase large subunit domain-containing protein n=1 Tax=Rubritalea sp. TaxID=2109375 RepID=UPI003EF9F602